MESRIFLKIENPASVVEEPNRSYCIDENVLLPALLLIFEQI